MRRRVRLPLSFVSFVVTIAVLRTIAKKGLDHDRLMLHAISALDHGLSLCWRG